MPIFPLEEKIRARFVPTPEGRVMTGITALGASNEYRLDGLNLNAYNFYRALNQGTRVVEDYFYLACGNVHCILGRLS